MRDGTAKLLSSFHTRLYRLSRGRLGRSLPGIRGPMLLLTTRGRTSGDAHTVPLLYLADGADLAVIASYGGRPHHPDWYLNLMADPRGTVQVDGDKRQVIASTAGPEDRDRLWTAALEAYPGYADYQAKTNREIPIVVLKSQ